MSHKIVRVTPVPLSAIRGIGAAQRSLPPCGPEPPATITADVDARHIGRVRITFTKMRGTHRRTRRWFWVAERAGLDSGHACDRNGRRERAVDESRDPPITGV